MTDILDRLFSHMDLQDDCWIWTGSKIQKGYGHIARYENGKFSAPLVHKVMYELLIGPVPDGKLLDHLCRVRACMNPDHLEPVTSKENTLRGDSKMARNARQTYCIHGHALTESNIYRDKYGRHCKRCVTDRTKRYRETKRAS